MRACVTASARFEIALSRIFTSAVCSSFETIVSDMPAISVALAFGEFRAAREKPFEFRFADRVGLTHERANDGDRDARLIPMMETFGMVRDDLFDQRNRLAPLFERHVDHAAAAPSMSTSSRRRSPRRRGRCRAAPRCRR